MSEEFLRVAKKEVSDDISSIIALLQDCSDDTDVNNKAAEIEKHMHKIKGLAPMMNQDKIGHIALLLDKLLKAVIDGAPVPGLYQSIKKSCDFMQSEITGSQTDFEQLKADIEKTHEIFLR